MKNRYNNKKYRRLFGVLIVGLFIFLLGCVYLDSVSIMQVQDDGSEAPVAKAGTEATFTLKGRIDAAEDKRGTRFIVSFLAPISWNIREHARVTYVTTLNTDNPDQELSMSVVPTSSLPKNGGGRTWGEALIQEYGVGPNVLNDMEWVTFETDIVWDIFNGDKPTYTVYIRTNVGEQNLKAYLGFFVNHTEDGISNDNDHKKVKFSDTPFEVIDGRSPTIDYSSDHFNKVQPLAVLQDDYVTFTFNGSAFDNDLVEFNEIYIAAKAYDANGILLSEVDARSAKTLLRREAGIDATFSRTIWPTDFFNVSDNEVISYIEYLFTNKGGSVTITQSDDDQAVEGTEIVGEKSPFVLELVCD